MVTGIQLHVVPTTPAEDTSCHDLASMNKRTNITYLGISPHLRIRADHVTPPVTGYVVVPRRSLYEQATWYQYHSIVLSIAPRRRSTST